MKHVTARCWSLHPGPSLQLLLLLLCLCLFLLIGQRQALAAPGDIVTIAGGGAGDGGAALSVPLTPETITYDASGNLYIADCNTHRVRKVDQAGVITTVAGVGGSGFYGDGGPAVQAALSCPSGVAVDSSGNLFISDQSNNRIRKVDASGVISTVAGTGSAGFSGDGGPATSATMNRPYGITVDASGSVFFADYANHRIRKISNSGIMSTVAGNGNAGFSGDGGSATFASLHSPIDVTVDSYGKLYIADTNNYRVRRVDAFGTITTFAGNATSGFSGDNGPATSASLRTPMGVHAAASGKVYIADMTDNRIRMVNVSGVISTVAGTGVAGFSGDGQAATAANLYYPAAVASDPGGNLVISDKYNCIVRKVDAAGIIATIAGNGSSGFFGEGVAATSAVLSRPKGVSMDASGNIYFVDNYNNRVRKIDANGVISTFAGTGSVGFSGDGGPAVLAKLNNPGVVAADSAGNLFLTDTYNYRIRKVAASGVISTAAGTGIPGYAGDYGPATAARINYASSVALDLAGNVFISDMENNRIRRIDPSGIITTIAGTGVAGFSGDGGPASAASINSPLGVAADAAGNVYFSDRGNQRIRKIDTTGRITTVAGNGTAGFSGDGGDALSASIKTPDGIALDAAGNIYFADLANHRVRKVDTNGIITTVAGSGTQGFSGDNGPATAASLNYPSGVFVDAAGNILIADSANNRIRRVNSALAATGNVIINAGAPSTNAAEVTLTLSCTSQSGTCTEMQLSNNGVAWSDAEPFSASKAWTLSAGDGEKWVFAKYLDEAGTWSSAETGTIILDTTPPAINITAPQSYSNASAPLLTYSLSDGSATVKVDGAAVSTVSGGYLDSLPEGPHTVRVEATDALGNLGFAEKVFTVDTVSPAVSVTSPAAGASYFSPPTLLYSTSDGTVTVRVDGVVVSKVSGNTLGTLSEGNHTVRVESRDVAGNVGFMEVPFAIDLVPTVSISSPATGATNNATPLLNYSVSNGTIAVKVDGIAVNKLAGDTLGPLADGTHTVRVEATDAAGTGFAERSFTVDTVAPTVTLISPAAGTTSDNQPLLSYAVSDGTVTVKVDGVVVSKVSGNRLAALTLGTHTVRVEARDTAGNVGAAEVTFSVTAPVFSSEDFESGNLTRIPWVLSGNGLWAAKYTVKHAGMYAAEAPVSITDSQSAAMEISKLCTAGNISFWFSVSSEGSFDYLTFYVDGVQKARWSGTVAWTQTSYPVTAGTHTFKWVYSKDSSVSSGSDTAWVDDIVFPGTPSAPTVTIGSPLSGVTNSNRPLLNYTVSDGTVVVKVDGIVVSKVSGNTLDTLSDGSHTVRVEATNAAGTGFAQTTFTVDTLSPTLGIYPVATPTAAASQILSGTRESSATINLSVDTAATVDTVSYPSATTWSCGVNNLVEGANMVTVTATDGAANSVSSAVTIILDTVSPEVTITAPLEGTINSRTPVLSYSLTEGTPVVTLDGVVVTKASGDTLGPLADGPHTVRVSAVDAAGNSAFTELSFTVDATAPTVTVTSPTVGVTSNRTPLLAFAVSDGTAVVTVDGSVLPLNSGDLLDTLADGPHTVRVDVTDAAGNASFAEVSFTVDTAAPAVTIASPAAGFSSSNTPVLDYSSSEGTVLVTVDGAIVSKVSGDALDVLADGLHVVRVEATDSVGNRGFAETTFTIDTTAPVVSITAPVAGPANRTPELVFTVTEGTVVVKVDGIPVSKVSGDLLDSLAAGAHTVRIEATDVAGNVGFSEVNFNVEIYSVTLNPGPNGSIEGPVVASYGDMPNYSIFANIGYHVTDIRVNGVSVGVGTSYSFTSGITADTVIAADFAANPFVIIMIADANGSIAGPSVVTYGDSANCTITPDVGYHVADVLVDGVSVGAVTSYSFADVTENHTISASFAINSYTISVSAGVNGSIAGPAAVNHGGSASYTITPAAGYHVADVLVDGVSVGAVGSYSLTDVTANHTISASFAINSYTISATAGANGSISGPATVNYGGSASYTITPAVGYHVADVLVDGVSVGAVTSYSFTDVTENHTISASFAINSYTISATAGANGSISGPATVNYGGSASYTITPAVGYHVADVLVDGVSVGAVTSYSFTDVTENHTISASFAINSYTISATAGANGSIAGPATANYGGSASYTITPAVGYHVADVLVDGVSVGAVGSYSLTDVTANHTISASFAINSYTISASAGTNGSIAGPAAVNYGGSASYTITPAVGYHVADVLVDGVNVGAVTSYSLADVTENHTISASFAINSYTISASAGTNGSIAGPAAVNYGGSVSYTITPAVGYHVADVLVDGVSVGAVTSYSFADVTENHTISASFAINSYTISASAGTNGSIAGPAAVNYGGSANYTISPAVGYHVADVLVDGVSVGAVGSYSLTDVTGNHTISASFAINSYTISVTAGANGSISGPATVNYGGNANYTITPAVGYHVADVLVDGVSVGAVGSYSLTDVTANHTISASFAINSYTISASAGTNGSIAGPATVNYGGNASYTITPAVGYHVADVLMDGVSVGAVGSYSLTDVTANHTISASFAINSYTISASAGTNGSIAGPATVNYGGNASYTITPATGYGVASVLVDGASVGAVTNYTFANVIANHTISVMFAPLADLFVSSVTAPTNASRGTSISVSSSIGNQGGNAGSFTVAFYLSKDTVATSDDILLGTKTVTSLNGGSTTTVSGSFTVPTGITTGKYYVNVIADSASVIDETNESNNTKAAGSTTNVKQ